MTYDDGMKAGRPPKSERTDFGDRLRALREVAGLSQRDMASRLGIAQPSYVMWERRNVSLRPEQLTQLAEILHVRVEELLDQPAKAKRGTGPTGKARQIFERVSQLPRATQQRILANVEDALTAHEVRKAS